MEQSSEKHDFWVGVGMFVAVGVTAMLVMWFVASPGIAVLVCIVAAVVFSGLATWLSHENNLYPGE